MTQTSTNAELDRVTRRIAFCVSTRRTTNTKTIDTLVTTELASASSVNRFGQVHRVNTFRVQGRTILGNVIGASSLGEVNPRRAVTLRARVGIVKWVPAAFRQCELLGQDSRTSHFRRPH